MRERLTVFVRDESGVTAIEYGLIAALIAVTIVVLLTQAGGALNTLWARIGACLSSPSTCT